MAEYGPGSLPVTAATISFAGKTYRADLAAGHDLSIAMDFHGAQPNHFSAAPASAARSCIGTPSFSNVRTSSRSSWSMVFLSLVLGYNLSFLFRLQTTLPFLVVFCIVEQIGFSHLNPICLLVGDVLILLFGLLVLLLSYHILFFLHKSR